MKNMKHIQYFITSNESSIRYVIIVWWNVPYQIILDWHIINYNNQLFQAFVILEMDQNFNN